MPNPLSVDDLIFIKWLNDNQGVLALGMFFVTLLIGWVSGIFSALRRKPKLKLSLVDGPTFCCTYLLGNRFGEYQTHQTGFALYLSIANIGSAASSIEKIAIAYHWHLIPFSWKWLRYTIGWHWNNSPTVALSDFQVRIGNSIKVYPFLIQANCLSTAKPPTFLEVGCSTLGVVYFEQEESWGGFQPRVINGKTKIKVRVDDVFGKSHSAIFWIPSVNLDYACKYNPTFGQSWTELNSSQPANEKFDAQNPSDSALSNSS